MSRDTFGAILTIVIGVSFVILVCQKWVNSPSVRVMKASDVEFAQASSKELVEYFGLELPLSDIRNNVSRDLSLIKSMGLIQPIDLIKIGNTKEISGSITGGILGVNGSFKSYDAVKFCWKNRDTIKFSVIPLSKIEIVEDSDGDLYAKFLFNYAERYACGESGHDNLSEVHTPNNLIESKFLGAMRIHVPKGKSHILINYLMPDSLDIKTEMEKNQNET